MVLAPKVDGAVLLSHRGGDFRLMERAAAVYLEPRRSKKQ
jgi:uncharacterized linocin/CFP29 family protein